MPVQSVVPFGSTWMTGVSFGTPVETALTVVVAVCDWPRESKTVTLKVVVTVPTETA